jgi:3-oxoacyl-[acyl-carrier-protein] synthase-3
MYVPDNVIDNDRLSRMMDTSDEWVRKRTGIVTRHYADLDQATSDMAVPAARSALEDAGIEKEAVDYVVFATMTPDHYFPGSGSIAQDKLGLPKVPCLDIRQQCAGFLYGLQLSDSLIRSGTAATVLLVGAEIHDAFMPYRSWDVLLEGADREVPPDEYDWNTRFRDRLVLFGDGAGAVVLTGEDDGDRGLLDCTIHADGSLWDKMWVPAGGTANRPYFDAEMQRDGRTIPIVVGREVFKTAVVYMPEAVNEVLGRNGFTLDDLDLLIMHQANLRINEAVQKRLGLPDEKVFNNIQKYGNTTAATIPIAFHEALRERDLPPGSLVCFVALGSGLNWGAALYRV